MLHISQNKFADSDRLKLTEAKTILLVEDETCVRDVIAEALRVEGFIVLEAADGQEALRISNRHLGKIHLLLADVFMPRLGGKTTAAVLTKVRSEMAVLYISGYSRDMLESGGHLTADDYMLQKPFPLQQLLHEVEATMLREPFQRFRPLMPDNFTPPTTEAKQDGFE